MQAKQKPPQAVDFRVPSGVSVVTLTGPNTGGKTASLKALGLAAAMAKAGLFLPLLTSAGKGCPPPNLRNEGCLLHLVSAALIKTLPCVTSYR